AEQVAGIRGRTGPAVAVQHRERHLLRRDRPLEGPDLLSGGDLRSRGRGLDVRVEEAVDRALDVARGGGELVLALNPADLHLEDVSRGKAVGELRVAEDRVQ